MRNQGAGDPDAAARLRERRILLTGISSALSRAATMLLAFTSVPVLLACLGKEQFGLLVAVTSMVTVLGFSDLGLGNSVLNALAEADGHKDDKAASEIVASGFAVIVVSTFAMGAVLLVVSPIVDWQALLRSPGPEHADAVGSTIVVVACCVLFNTVLSLVPRIEQGQQRGYEVALWQTFGTVATLILLIVATEKHAGMPLLAGLLVAGPAVGTLGNGASLAIRKPWLVPQVGNIQRELVGALLRSGSLWLILQVAYVIGTSIDTFMAAWLVGPSAAADYSIHNKLFLVVPMLAGFLQQPLWPAYREAICSGDNNWAATTLKKAIIYSAAEGVGFSLLLALAAGWVIPFLSGGLVRVDLLMILGLTIWTSLYTMGNAVTMYLHAQNEIRIQCIWWGAFAVVSLGLKLLGVSRFGVWVLPWASLTSYMVCVGVPGIVYVRNTIGKSVMGHVRDH